MLMPGNFWMVIDRPGARRAMQHDLIQIWTVIAAVALGDANDARLLLGVTIVVPINVETGRVQVPETAA